MIDILKYETDFTKAQKTANEIAVKMTIARQGIDPEAISRQDFDRIMRLNMCILELREKTAQEIANINQTAAIEHNKLVEKIQVALSRYQPKSVEAPEPETLESLVDEDLLPVDDAPEKVEEQNQNQEPVVGTA